MQQSLQAARDTLKEMGITVLGTQLAILDVLKDIEGSPGSGNRRCAF